MRLIAWILRAALFLLLFGLALNNQHEVFVRGLFGTEWRSPMIVVVLASFVAGVALTLFALGWKRLPVRNRVQPTAPGPLGPAAGSDGPARAAARPPAPPASPDTLALGAADGPPRDGP